MPSGCEEPTLKPSTADKDLSSSMQLLTEALKEHIQRSKSSNKGSGYSKAYFHQLLDVILSDWSTYIALPNSSKFKKTFQRALGIQPQMAHFDEKSFDIYRHQHDLECLARIAISIKRLDVGKEIRKLQPFCCESPQKRLINGTGSKIKDVCIQLKDEAKDFFEKKNWAMAMNRFTQAIHFNSEDAILYAGRAVCEINLSKFQLAFEDAEDALQLNPKCDDYRQILSQASLGLTPYQSELKLSAPAEIYSIGEKKIEGAFPFICRADETVSAEAQFELGRMLTFVDGSAHHDPTAKTRLLKIEVQGEKHKDKKWVEGWIRNAKRLMRFELETNLYSEKMTTADRLERFSSYYRYKFSGIDDILDLSITFKSRMPTTHFNPAIKPDIDEWMPLMIKRAKQGSFKAQCFFTAHQIIVEANKVFRDNKIIESFKLLREARRLWDCPIIDTTIFVKTAEKMLKDKISHAEIYHLLVCLNNTISPETRLFLASESVKLDPTVPDYFYALGLVYYELIGDYKNGLKAIDRALKMNANAEWLYDRATCLRLGKERLDYEVVEAYEKFLSCNPPDGRFVPEAYYCVSLAYYTMLNMEKSSIYMRKALRAESPNVRLPCLKPIDPYDFVPKNVLKNLSKPNGYLREKSLSKLTIFEVFCVVCSRVNPSLFCSYCQKWVCGPVDYDTSSVVSVCQVNHTIKHKTLVSKSL